MKRIITLLLAFAILVIFSSPVSAQLRGEGDTCNAQLEDQCAPGLVCRGQSLTGTDGICVAPGNREAFPTCGGLGQRCCYDTEFGDWPNAAWCFEGTKYIEGGGMTTCECLSSGDGQSDLGGTCSVDADCFRGSCDTDGVCRVTSGCIDLSATEFTEKAAQKFCEQADNIFCTQERSTSPYDRMWCCSSYQACRLEDAKWKDDADGEDYASQTGKPFDYCQQVPGDIDDNKTQRGACFDCVSKGKEGEYIYTAVGCIHMFENNQAKVMAESFIKLLLGVAGLATFLSILAAAFILTTSRGESAKVKEAKELITAAVSGLLFIIFSIIILQYIGVTILRIPGLN